MKPILKLLFLAIGMAAGTVLAQDKQPVADLMSATQQETTRQCAAAT